MIEACLKRKIVFKFLKEYKQKKWNSIIPSLLEIGILYLYNTFKKSFFLEEDLLEIIENMKSKIINSMIIPFDKTQLRNNYQLDKKNLSLNNRNSHRSFSKKSKNINELNIFTSDTLNNRLINFYNKTSRVTPKNKLIKKVETEENLIDNKFKKFWKLDKTINNQNNNINKINNKNVTNVQSINYNTIDINNTYRSNKTFLSYNNSILLNNSTEIEYIKVNKAEKMKRLKTDQITINNSNNNKTYIKDMNNDIISKIDGINKNLRIQKINNFKQEDLLLNDYNKSNTKRQLEKKCLYTNNFFLNKQKYYSSNKSNLPYSKNNNDLNSMIKSKKLKNLYNKFNLKKITNKDIRNKQFLKLQKTEIKNNYDDIESDNIENINDININNTIRNTTNISIDVSKYNLINLNEKNNTINYNSLKSEKSFKIKTFINDPNFFVKVRKNKRKVFKKF